MAQNLEAGVAPSAGLLTTLIEKSKLPSTSGTPLITPAGLMDIPRGRPVPPSLMDHMYGERPPFT
jgi:hypothetical protein